MLLAVKHGVVLDHESVVLARAFFEQVARDIGGEYDGWEASV